MRGWGWMRAGLLALGLMGALPALADDRDVLTALLEDNLSGAGRVVTITGFQGALSSQAQIARITIADDQGIWLTLNGVTLDWDRATLFGGVLNVRKLTADDIALDRLPQTGPATALPKAEAAPFALPTLPVAVVLGEVSARHIRLGPAVLGQTVDGTISADASLVNGAGHIRLALDRTDGVTGHVSVIAVYGNDTNELTLAVEAEEAAGGLAVTALGVPGAPAAHLVLGGKGPLDGFAASMKLDTDGQTRLAGTLTLKSAANGATGFAADLTGNMAPLFTPDYAAFFGTSTVLHATGQRHADGVLDMDALSLTAQALQLYGHVTIAADGLPDRVTLTGDLRQTDGSAVLLPLPGVATRVGSAHLDLAYDRAKSDAWTGRIDAKGLDRPDLTAEELVLTGTGQIRHSTDRGLAAALIFAGTGLHPTDAGLAQALGTDISGSIGVNWHAGTGQVALSNLDLTAGDLRLTTQGKIGGLDTGFRLDGQLQARAADLTRFAGLAQRPLAGAADLTLSGWVSPLSGQFDADIAITSPGLKTRTPQLDGLIAGPSKIALSGKRDETGTTLRSLSVTTDTGLTARLAGQIATAGVDLSGTLHLTDLGVLNLGLSGGVTADAAYTGTLAEGHLTLKGTGLDLALGQAQADALAKGTTQLDLDLQLAGQRVKIDRATLFGPTLSLAATGLYDPAGSTIALQAGLPDLSVLLPGWRGAAKGTLDLAGTMQALTAKVSATSDGLALGQVLVDRLIGGAGRLTAAVQLNSNRLVIDALDFATPALTVKASGAPEALDVNARMTNLALILPEFPGPLTARGTVKQTAGQTALDLAMTGPGRINARMAGTLAADFTRAELTAKGTSQAGLANVLIAPRVVAGTVAFDLALKGPLTLASLTGTASVKDGKLADPALPVTLVKMQATARLSGGTAQVTVASALSSGGTLAVTGSLGLTPPLPANLAITLTHATIRDPQLYQTTLDGHLTFIGPALGGAVIAGNVTLAKTELRIPSTSISALPVLADLHHKADPADVRATRARAGLEGASARGAAGGGGFGLDVQVAAPNQVFIRGRGLDAELGGQVRLTGTTAAIVPSGGFSLIRGRLDLLGKRLTLSEATLQLQGALVPYIRIAATTDSDGFSISAVIEGDALNPTVSFTSAPQLPQEEVLARLLFNKDLQTLSAFQAAQLAGAVATLAGKGGEGLIDKLRKSAGLDNLDVQSDGTGNTSVTAGKYLSKKVYTEVTVDQTGKSTLNLNLDLANHITLRGSVQDSGETGLGIYLERDY